MERIFVKTWVYTFVTSLALCIIFLPDSFHSTVNGTSYTVPMRDYVLEILRRSLSVSLTITAIVAVILLTRFVLKKRV